MRISSIATTLLAFVAQQVSSQTIADIVVASEVHQTLEAAVIAAPAGVLALLSDATQSLTLFAPDDTAFAGLVAIVGQAYLNDLLTPVWSEHLTCVLASHLLDGAVPSSAITGPLSVTSLFGTVLSLNNVNGAITVDGNPVTVPDLAATNGVVHSISGLPILPPCVTQSITAIASGADSFTTLVSLVTAAGLGDALTNTRPLTLFAPTNAAFAAVPAPVLQYLGSNVTALTEVLLYHVVSGNEVFGGNTNTNVGTFQTLQGDSLIVRRNNAGTLKVNNGVDFVNFDTLASNGVIQVIDEVLIPPSLSLPGGSAPSASPGGGKGGKKGGKSGKKGGKSGKSGKKGGKKSSFIYHKRVKQHRTDGRLVNREQQDGQDAETSDVGSWMTNMFDGGK